MSSVENYATRRAGQVAVGEVSVEPCQAQAAINAGLLVTRLGTTNGNDRVKAPATASEAAAICGAVKYDPSWPRLADGQTTDYGAGDILGVIAKGSIVLTCETGGVRGQQVFVRYAAGAGGTVLGAIRNAAVADEAVAVPGVRFRETTSSGPVFCDLNLPAT